MSFLSKTGLVPSSKKSVPLPDKRKNKIDNFILTATVVKPVEFSVRPFGGLYNPYSKSCSVLCNHPAPSAVRTVIKKVKDSWSSESKTYYGSHKENFESVKFDTTEQIPEELFRRYTDTDSRPMTPSPTSISIRTRTSGGSFLSRRCVTPEPGKDLMGKRKKIILDLRRSHSQETVYKASSEFSQGAVIETPSHIANASPIEERSILEVSKQEQAKKKINNGSENMESPAVEENKVQGCVHDRDNPEEDGMQRRGKKRRKSKHQPATTTFHLNQDPETQISTLGPDSLNPSTRPSLIPNAANLFPPCLDKTDDTQSLLKDSFLSEEAFRVLKTDLDVDVIENTFGRYLNRALQEAMKYVTPKKKNIPEKYISQVVLKDLYFEENKFLPRKLSKSASRFEMPLDLKSLQYITVFDYLSQFVWISKQRKQMYRKTFLKFITKDDLDEAGDPLPNTERRILVVNFPKALHEVLGFYSNDEVIKTLCELVEIEEYEEINFRSWCGILAFAERLALHDPQSTDSCDELEKSDFDSLQDRLGILDLEPNMNQVFEIIRRGHVGRF